MAAEAVHEGGCLCGDLRYAMTGAPVRASVCHCTYCQRRTGSAFAVLPFFREGQLRLLRGTPSAYRHISDASGRWLEHGFCPRCGTTVTLRVERAPGAVGIPGGTFDDPRWFEPSRHIWTGSKLPWVAVPDGAEQHPGQG